MYLTRIDEIDLSWNGRTVKLNKDRTIAKSSEEALNEVASFVASTLHIDAKSGEVEEPAETEPTQGDAAAQGV